MYSGVGLDDTRIKNIDHNYKRVFSCMYGHLDMIYKFYYDTDKEYGVFCEDDIYIHNSFNTILMDILEEVNIMKLDILLLGYLIPYNIESSYYEQTFARKERLNNINMNNKYYTYPNDLWGTQMYLLTRVYAKYVLDSFSQEYAEKTLIDAALTPFSADWTITKNGNRALLYPMLAVEDGKYKSGDYWQDKFHKDCHLANFNANYIL
jgi:GR25 family glycosyltransferase involved in LPS biosynthesis